MDHVRRAIRSSPQLTRGLAIVTSLRDGATRLRVDRGPARLSVDLRCGRSRGINPSILRRWYIPPYTQKSAQTADCERTMTVLAMYDKWSFGGYRLGRARMCQSLRHAATERAAHDLNEGQ